MQSFVIEWLVKGFLFTLGAITAINLNNELVTLRGLLLGGLLKK